MQILDRAKLWKEGMMEQIKREITIMKDLRKLLARHAVSDPCNGRCVARDTMELQNHSKQQIKPRLLLHRVQCQS